MSVRFQDSDSAALLTDACGIEPTYTCEKILEWTDSEFVAVAAEWVLDRPIRMLLIGSARGSLSESCSGP